MKYPNPKLELTIEVSVGGSCAAKLPSSCRLKYQKQVVCHSFPPSDQLNNGFTFFCSSVGLFHKIGNPWLDVTVSTFRLLLFKNMDGIKPSGHSHRLVGKIDCYHKTSTRDPIDFPDDCGQYACIVITYDT